MKRHIIRGLTVALLGASVLALTAVPAQAFTLGGSCDGSTANGERQMFFHADNGKPLGTGIWNWHQNSSGAHEYHLWTIDDNLGDGASMVTQVVSGGRTISYQHMNNYKITYSVSKYRFVWNGYASSWFASTSCSRA
ncbi:hypothetical protein GCM10023107_35250 [Actinoplanes octamycinicus]|nr:hypothetical protein Aoc01nite_28470 [Actinoplanes octamycinicus]